MSGNKGSIALGAIIWVGLACSGAALSWGQVPGVPYRVADLAPGEVGALDSVSGFDAAEFVVTSGYVLFPAEVDLGIELYRSDGTESGTLLVKDIAPGSEGSDISEFIAFRDEAYFRASTRAFDSQLWKSDGTEAGTVILKDVAPASITSGTLFAGADVFYFFAGPDFGSRDLWKSDGTEDGTVVVASGLLTPSYAATVGNTLFFDGRDGLWASDGTEEGTALVRDENEGGARSIRGFYPHEGLLYFSGTDTLTGTEPWRSDGTFEGTYRITETWPGDNTGGPDGFAAFEGNVYFTANDGVDGWELWRTDGTDAGSYRVIDLWEGPGSGFPESIVPLGGQLLFIGKTAETGSEWYRTDGTELGTELVADLAPGEDAGASWLEVATLGGQIFFRSTKAEPTGELWVTDGSEAGTGLVADIDPVGDSAPRFSTSGVAGNLLFFTADDGTTGRELWAIVSAEESPDLSLDGGSCPGPATLTIEGAAPEARLAILASLRSEAFSVPLGVACSGTVLALDDPALMAVVEADPDGSRSLTQSLPPGACGAYVQVVELREGEACPTSTVVQIPKS